MSVVIKVPEDVPCDFCGATLGERCWVPSGRPRATPHKERLALFRAEILRDELAHHLFIEQHPDGVGSDYDGADAVLEMVIQAIRAKFPSPNPVAAWLVAMKA